MESKIESYEKNSKEEKIISEKEIFITSEEKKKKEEKDNLSKKIKRERYSGSE